jgi:GDP-4-dehydro-6-deoxy-D-mannose reductase
VVRMRAFNHAGPGQSDAYVISKFARQIAEAGAASRADEPVEIVTGNLHVRRDFTDVRDVVRAYWLALEQAAPGVYNVCSGRSTEISEILAGLARHAGVELEQITDPALLREHEVEEIRGSHARLTAATGWEPEIPLERTLADTVEWWRERAVAAVTG